MLSQQQQQQQQRHLDIWSFPMGSHNIYVDGRRHFKGFTRKSLKFNAIMRCYAQQNIANARHSVCLSLSRVRVLVAMLTSWGMKTNFDAFGPRNGKCFTFFHRNRWKNSQSTEANSLNFFNWMPSRIPNIGKNGRRIQKLLTFRKCLFCFCLENLLHLNI